MKGINPNVLSSNPNQANRILGEVITKNTLINIDTKNVIKEGENHIGEKVKPIDGAWARKLNLAYLSIHVDVISIEGFDSSSFGENPLHVVRVGLIYMSHCIEVVLLSGI